MHVSNYHIKANMIRLKMENGACAFLRPASMIDALLIKNAATAATFPFYTRTNLFNEEYHHFFPIKARAPSKLSRIFNFISSRWWTKEQKKKPFVSCFSRDVFVIIFWFRLGQLWTRADYCARSFLWWRRYHRHGVDPSRQRYRGKEFH